tara:strand:+ start:2713 stop:3180 length:468 start_codon:yes stop_codon:yes gene_type:complete
MSYVQDFFKKHGAAVASVVVVLLTTITVFHMLGVTFPQPGADETINKIVTIETIEEFSTDRPAQKFSPGGLEEGACKKYSSDPHGMEKYCSGLSDDSCATMGCRGGLGCVWLNKGKCVAGDREGPTFHTHKGIPVDVHCWRWRRKNFGSCPADTE